MIAELDYQVFDRVGCTPGKAVGGWGSTTVNEDDVSWRWTHQMRPTRLVQGGCTYPGVSSDGEAWARETLRLLEAIGSLPEDWDGRGGPPIDQTLIGLAKDVLKALTGTVPETLPVPVACPIRGGVFQFEWALGGKYLEIEFSDKRVLYFVTQELTPQGPVMVSGEYPVSMMKRTRQLLEWLVQR